MMLTRYGNQLQGTDFRLSIFDDLLVVHRPSRCSIRSDALMYQGNYFLHTVWRKLRRTPPPETKQ